MPLRPTSLLCHPLTTVLTSSHTSLPNNVSGVEERWGELISHGVPCPTSTSDRKVGSLVVVGFGHEPFRASIHRSDDLPSRPAQQYAGGRDKGWVGVPVDTSGRTHWFEFSGIDSLHCLSQTAGDKHFWYVTVGLLSLSSQVPLGWNPSYATLAPACFTRSFFEGRKDLERGSPPPMWGV